MSDKQSTPTVDEVREAKAELERTIQDALAEFVRKTTVTVEDVRVMVIRAEADESEDFIVNVDVSL